MRRGRKGISRAGGALVALAVVVGLVVGVGGFTFVYAEGGSYLSNDPAACANCHVMDGHYEAWEKGSHGAVATCNDCHAPHDSLAGKLWVKGKNGFNHSLRFTTGRFHEPIRITPSNRAVTEGACRHCHADVVHAIDTGWGREPISCIRCHGGVGHME